MKYRIHIPYVVGVLLLGFAFLGTQRATAQDDGNQDNNPHIRPRDAATPTPTPIPKASPAQKQQDQNQGQYDRPPFPGDAPGTQPAQPRSQPTSKSSDGYDRPAFPGDAPGTNPTGAAGAKGESSSSDSQIDLHAQPKDEPEPAPAEADDSEFKPWDPHKAAKDVEVGNYYLKLKNYRAALERFNHALTYKPNDADATFGLALTQEKLGLLSLASQSYHKYLEILPNGPKSKDANEAIERLGPQVTSLKPATASPPAYAEKTAAHDIDVGETYLSANNYDAARERFEEALRLSPENPLACFRMAQSLQGMQRLDPARMYYRKYLELEPKGKFAKNAKKAINDIDYILGK
ncbi:MAG TPA: tetratricopeptide repeat protein [Candidatus Angelobacter sp.]|nr:tetratricopeptide repeat protein [Candidatus Angelobacter sp.]